MVIPKINCKTTRFRKINTRNENERIKTHGVIRIPKGFLDILGVKTGESVELAIANRKVLIEPSKDQVDELQVR